ncbi:unnamed protein product [marine sediment metagenome]|uniref:Uncharacterized protein n=1 Tax=marine sediment metagenome TaxID=412755 RepID=X0YDC4_9ZZZZ
MPLKKEQLVKMAIDIQKAEAGLKEVEFDVRQARRAGIDVAAEENELVVLRKSIRGLKNVYKPV